MMPALPSLAAIAALVLRLSLILCVGAAAAWTVGRASAALRHGIWLATVLGTLVTGAIGALPLGRWRGEVGLAWPVLAAPGTFEERLAAVLVAGWLVGFAVAALRTCRAIASASTLASSAEPVEPGAWAAQLARAVELLRLGTPPELRHSSRTHLPFTWGIRRPVIVLPADAAQWSDDRRRVVLLHECAHVRRGDSAIELLAGLVGALYWFHPGVWGAIRGLRLAREEACDRLVIEAGTPAPEYAEHLLAVLRAANHARWRAAAAPGLAGTRSLERRLRALARSERPHCGRRGWRAVVLAPLLLGVGLALWAPAERPGRAPLASVPSSTRGKAVCACPAHRPPPPSR